MKRCPCVRVIVALPTAQIVLGIPYEIPELIACPECNKLARVVRVNAPPVAGTIDLNIARHVALKEPTP